MRIALGLEYSGEYFYGWQYQKTQPHNRTVQGCLEAALSAVADHPVSIICAGRTDRGVHALEQVVHADVQVKRPDRAWLMGTNSHLPSDINVLWACRTDETFHARFSAQARHYRYLLFNHPVRPAIMRHQVTWFHKTLNIQKMREGAAHLLGTHDFNAYRAAGCQAKNPVRTLHMLDIQPLDGHYIAICASANGFLHHMVRNIVGVLLAIGSGKYPPDWAKDVLQARDRRAGGVTAPANGLYLSGVDYPDVYQLPMLRPGLMAAGTLKR